jgi:hypothetical protein
MAQNNLRIHPSVDAIIKPIIYDMTKIDISQKTNPIIGKNNEPDYIKEMKKRCVHIIFDNGEYRPCVKKNENGELVCSACGRKINIKFDGTAVDTIMECIAVMNQLVFFGLLNGLRAEPLETLISIKTQLPAAAQLLKELNLYVKNENQNNDDSSNIGLEYATPSATLRPITQLG